MNYYCIVLKNDLTNDMLEEAVTDSSALRYSLDGSKAILKFSTQFANSMKGYTKYSLEDILVILSGVEWSSTE